MKRITLFIVFLIFLTGCSRDEVLDFPGEDNIQIYFQKMLEITDAPDFDYSLSIEDFFTTAMKAKLLKDNMIYLVAPEGVLADSSCTIYLPIGELSAFCDGKTRLYIDGELKKEFVSDNKQGRSYMLMSEEISKRIAKYISTPYWFQDSIKGKKIYTRLYMTEDDWGKALLDKDPYNYLCLDVYIKDE